MQRYTDRESFLPLLFARVRRNSRHEERQRLSNFDYHAVPVHLEQEYQKQWDLTQHFQRLIGTRKACQVDGLSVLPGRALDSDGRGDEYVVNRYFADRSDVHGRAGLEHLGDARGDLLVDGSHDGEELRCLRRRLNDEKIQIKRIGYISSPEILDLELIQDIHLGRRQCDTGDGARKLS